MGSMHSRSTDNHSIEAWVFADATARGAFTGYPAPLVDDVGRLAYEAATNTYHRLTGHDPRTWASLTTLPGAGSITPAMLTFDPATQVELDAVAGAATAAGTAASDVSQDLADHALVAAAQAVLGHMTLEQLQDAVAAMLTDSGLVTVAYDDTGNLLDISAAVAAAQVTGLAAAVVAALPLGVRAKDVGWYQDSAIAVATAFGPIYRLNASMDLRRLTVNVKVAGVGDSTFRVLHSSDFAAWTPLDLLTLTGATKTATLVYGSVTIPADSWVRFDIITVGGTPPQGMTAQLTMDVDV